MSNVLIVGGRRAASNTIFDFRFSPGTFIEYYEFFILHIYFIYLIHGEKIIRNIFTYMLMDTFVGRTIKFQFLRYFLLSSNLINCFSIYQRSEEVSKVMKHDRR